MRRKFEYLIGVDCGANLAIAYWSTKHKYLGLIETHEGHQFEQAIQNVRTATYPVSRYDLLFIVEDANLDSPVFGSWSMFKTALLPYVGTRSIVSQAKLKQLEKLYAIELKKAQDIGKNKLYAQLFIKELQRLKLNYILVPPSKRDRAYQKKESLGGKMIPLKDLMMPTKLTHKDFVKITGYEYGTNEHGRDAAMLVHNNSYNKIRYKKGIKSNIDK